MLSDPEKREVYDEFGEQGIKEGGGKGGAGFTDPFNMFNMFFGGGGGPGGPAGGGGKQKSKPIVHKLTVTLEELFNGKVRSNAKRVCHALKCQIRLP